MSSRAERILAVIDPTRTEQWALQKAVAVAHARNGADVIAYLCAWSAAKAEEPQQLVANEIRRNQLWLEEFLSGFAARGIPIETLVAWHPNWREGICETARETGADMVIKRASGRAGSFGSSDRHLIRNLKTRSLYLMNHELAKPTKTVLVALDFNAIDSSHAALNEAISALGKRVCEGNPGAELHSISAFPSSERFVHPPDVAKLLGIERRRAHVRQGPAGVVIPATANLIEADLVIVGNVGRRGLAGITVGNTSEKILSGITADVLVIFQELTHEREAA